MATEQIGWAYLYRIYTVHIGRARWSAGATVDVRTWHIPAIVGRITCGRTVYRKNCASTRPETASVRPASSAIGNFDEFLELLSLVDYVVFLQ